MKLLAKNFKGTLKNGKPYRIGINTTDDFVTVNLFVSDCSALAPTFWLDHTESRLYAPGYKKYRDAFKECIQATEKTYNLTLIK